MAKQVNISFDFPTGESRLWTSEWSSDGYKGRLTDTVYEGGASYTDWCVYTSDCDADVQTFLWIAEDLGVDSALKWAEEEAHKTFVAMFGELPTLS